MIVCVEVATLIRAVQRAAAPGVEAADMFGEIITCSDIPLLHQKQVADYALSDVEVV
jgi:microcompartment protein CcmL/EutN